MYSARKDYTATLVIKCKCQDLRWIMDKEGYIGSPNPWSVEVPHLMFVQNKYTGKRCAPEEVSMGDEYNRKTREKAPRTSGGHTGGGESSGRCRHHRDEVDRPV